MYVDNKLVKTDRGHFYGDNKLVKIDPGHFVRYILTEKYILQNEIKLNYLKLLIVNCDRNQYET